METKNRRILVTGAGTGIGSAIARRLAKDGFRLALHCHSHIEDTNKLAADLADCGCDCSVVCFDVADTAAAEAALNEDMDKYGAYWGVISNAGITRDAPLPALEKNDWFDVINTNLGGFYNVVKPCVMPMIHLRDGGRIITVSSLSGVAGNRGQTNYSASKGGLIAASKSLALELGKRGITVNSIAPGLIETKMADQATIDAALGMIPLRRIGKPEEVAAVAGFLCSDGAAYITRQVINVNGGMY